MIKFICFTILISLCGFVHAQTGGNPFLRNFLPEEYGAEAQVWSIVQDNRGVMYFATTDYLVEYDGNQFRQIYLPNRNIIRSLAIDNYGTVFIGGYSEFGYLEPDSTGKLNYKSLSILLDSTQNISADIWRTFAVAGKIYFQSSNQIFIYTRNQNRKPVRSDIKIINDNNRFYLSNVCYNEVFIFKRPSGLGKIKNDSLITDLPCTSFFKNESIRDILPYPGNRYLIISNNSGIWVYNPHETEKNRITKNAFNKKSCLILDHIIKNDVAYSSAIISDTVFAIGTLRGGIIQFDWRGNILKKVNKQNGLQSESVYCLFKDIYNNIWAGTSHGFSYIELNTGLTYFDEKYGFSGLLYNIYRINKILYLGTSLGLFIDKNGKLESFPDGKQNNYTQIFDVKPYTRSDGEKVLLVAQNYGIDEIYKTVSNRLFKKLTYEICVSAKDTSLFYFSENNTLFYSKYLNKKWIDPVVVTNLKVPPYNLLEDKNGNIWTVADEKPVVVFNPLQNPVIKYFKDQQNINDIRFYTPFKDDTNVYFTTNRGIYLYSEKQQQIIADTALLNGIFVKSTPDFYFYNIVNNNEHVFIVKQNNFRTGYYAYKKNNKWFIDSISLSRVKENDIIFSDGDSLLWSITAKKLLKIDKKRPWQLPVRDNVLIREVIFGNDSVTFNGAYFTPNNEIKLITNNQPDALVPVLRYKYNHVTFIYSLAAYINATENEYSYMLQGSNQTDQWSDWTKLTRKEYTNLREGKYSFFIKGRNIYGQESKTAVYRFVIEPPWYRTFWAYLFYLIIGIIVIWIIVKINTYRLIKEKEHLEELVEERTQEVVQKNAILFQQNEEITAQAENLQEVNALLVERNEEINQQKEEILSILENLQQANNHISLVNSQLSKANQEITKKNKSITDSIQYASRIQNALLPTLDYIKENTAESLVIYKPKNIVSGDFYWFKKILFQEQEIILLAVADCTGHGVPGAFMSLLSITFLNDIIRHEHITSPAKVLNELRKQIKISLKQTGKDRESKDGLDIAFCEINSGKRVFNYAGANIPLVILKKNDAGFGIHEIKPDKMPVGVYINEKNSFTDHTIRVDLKDIIYLYTDGFPDQLGGEDRRKYMHRNFREFLVSIAENPLSEQKLILEKELENWKKDREQTDDITVLGIRI